MAASIARSSDEAQVVQRTSVEDIASECARLGVSRVELLGASSMRALGIRSSYKGRTVDA